MRGLKKPRIVIKTTGKPSGALKALAASTLAGPPLTPTPAPPEAVSGPVGMPDVEPPMPQAGATDGLGAGQGGLAVHPSLRGHNIGGREPRHTSRTR